MKLLSDDELERSAVVANCRMNRERDLTGSNGYSKEIGFNPLDYLRDENCFRPSGRLARPLLRNWQGTDRGCTDLPLRRHGYRNCRSGPGRDVPSARR